MAGRDNSWAVVASVSEPAPLVAAMAVHHIALGASEVHLYLDKPAPQVRSLLAGFAQVRIVLCDETYWRGQRPALSVARQVANANHAYRRTQAAWLLHCDADEFVSGTRPLAEALAGIPDRVDCARLPNVERVVVEGRTPANLFDGPFRVPFGRLNPQADWTAIYGEGAVFLNRGLTGHGEGKMLTRTGKGHKILIHRAAYRGKPPVSARGMVRSLLAWTQTGTAAADDRVPWAELKDHRLLHYDGLTGLHFLAKMLRHHDVTGPADRPAWPASRVAQVIESRRLAEDGPALRRFVDGLRSISAQQARQLAELGKLYEPGQTPITALRALCPQAEVDGAGFDAILRRREATLLAGRDPWA